MSADDHLDLRYIPITGPGVDALEARKECDDGPSEGEVTERARQYFRRYGPPDWSADVLRKVQELCREKRHSRS